MNQVLFKIDPELSKLFDIIGGSDFEDLKVDIEENGVKVPIIVAEDGTIVDGHQRYHIWVHELGKYPWDIPYEVKPYETREAMLYDAITLNLLRRHLNRFQRGEVAMLLEPLVAEVAKERQKATQLVGKDKEGTPIFGDVQLTTTERGTTRDLVAKKVGMAGSTFERVKKIKEVAPPEIIKKLRKGETTINKEYRKIQRAETVAKLTEEVKELVPPEGKFNVIVVDPPWPYESSYDPDSRRVANPYPVMTLTELGVLEMPADEDCILWLWTTNAFMHQAYHLLQEWKFEPKTILTWVKSKMGVGHWLRGKTEHCILAVRGKPKINSKSQTTIIDGKAREHSRKPEEFYNMVDEICYGRKLDYFSREKRDGWETFGTMELEEENGIQETK